MTDQQVLISRQGSLGRLHLNRPKALNSVTLAMIRTLDTGLTRFETDPSITSVLITGEGARGLCAGGDIIALYKAASDDHDAALNFWAEEYRLNARIARFPKPYIAFMDGITMGGGVGVSAHGRFRIVTERTRLAMPETGIGLVPDVGGSWLLGQNAPGELGTYIGLTGSLLGAGDAIHAGLADCYMPADRLEQLVTALAAIPPEADKAALADAIAGLSEPAPASTLAGQRAAIDDAFAAPTVEDILDALDRQGTVFATANRETLSAKSPTALKMTLMLLREARHSQTLEQCLNREFAAVSHLFCQPDFREGVRAAVIDKDCNPKWQPDTLAKTAVPDLAGFGDGKARVFATNKLEEEAR
ncbi:enoyl-CoA hydratase/isomerase family protein [Marinovum sp.]|uniref:enoyl-CoA hydratase/isomerase family protein n=1 Tax=Marinovum sp. TaxID=2024839 RepID=UPI002B26F02E|nr:enoyl-CoA hydratase/isomerase family protein [Marinovum sp.]